MFWRKAKMSDISIDEKIIIKELEKCRERLYALFRNQPAREAYNSFQKFGIKIACDSSGCLLKGWMHS